MNTLKELEDRRSIRKYKNIDVDKETILHLLQAATLAPSGCNTQPWRFLVIKDSETKKKVAKADHNQDWMLTDPVFIVCMADLSSRGIENLSYVDEHTPSMELKMTIRDTSNAIMNLLTEAQHLGLSTCWTAWFEQQEMRKATNVPDNLYITGVITLGYADEEPKKRPRRPLSEIVRFENWD